MQRRRIPLDQATPRQRELVDELREAVYLPGTLSGLILGDGPWDVRLLTTEGDQSWITRLVDPDLQNFPASFDHLQLLLGWSAGVASPSIGREESALGEQRTSEKLSASGEHKGLLWYRRPYTPKVAADSVSSTDIAGRFSLLRTIAQLVEHYHSASRVHGNPALSNVLVHRDGSFSLVDPGFALYCPSARLGRSALAPELGVDSVPTPGLDIYTLGKVGRKMFGGLTLSDELARLIDVMLSSESSRRPSIHWVLGVLNELQDDQILRPERTSRPKGLLRGSAGDVASAMSRSGDLATQEALLAAPSPQPEHRPTSTSPVDHQPPGEREAPPSPRPYSWLPMALIALIVVIAIFRFMPGQRREPIDFYADWTEGRPQRMREVAKAAVIDSDPEARLAIFDAARAGFTSSHLRSEVLAAAVEGRWEEELSDEQLTTVLRLGIGPLIREAELPALSAQFPPQVLFSILARSPIEVKFPELQPIPPNRLQELPSPIGGVFKGLQALGVKSLEDPEARAVAHLLANDVRPPILEAFVAPTSDEARLLAKLDIVKDVLEANEQLSIGVLGAILERSPSIRSLLSWFDGDGIDTWKAVQPQTRFIVSLGVVGPSLSYEQLVDLLSFARMSVREAAGRQLLGNPSFSGVHDILPFLVGPQNTLSRMQVISLASALQTTGRDQLFLVHGWLRSRPSPLTVAHLLLARDGKGSKDGFNLEAARYLLKARETKLPRDMLTRLSTHAESMARAYAYASLDPTHPEDRRTLEAAQAREKSPRLVTQLEGLLR